MPRGTLIVVFRGSYGSDPPASVNDVDSLEVRWFDPAAALAAITHPGERQRVADALEDSPGAVYRAIID